MARRWHDPKKLLWLLGMLAPASALLPSQLVLHTGVSVFWWSGAMLFFLVIPVVDALAGEDGNNPSDAQVRDLQHDRFYRWCTFLFLPVQYAGLVVACYLVTFGTLSAVDKIGYAVSVGLVAGIGINAAHELGHRVETNERWLAKIALAQSLYGHFHVEHNRGHHARVATPADPASARMGESLYRFLPRSVGGAVVSAWTLEKQRLERKGSGVWTVRNNVLNAWAMSAALFGVLVAVFGVGILPFLMLQAVVGVMTLESVNYIEHYGLLRARTPAGRYERCAPRHSWNSDRIVTNIFLYHLQRHSDHHANPGRRFQTLRTFDEAPQLPAGYATMVVLAAVPPLWRRLMDPKVVAHYDGDVTRANLQPSARARLERRWATVPERVAAA
ncbi:alkane 1-monooxygenase [Rhodococcus sp. BP-349]|uniref:alkane 1-monooxygenase n=1 Tax=unclassified Rhodococcus (in: high G+C Gram-positive bacteria) TaxID=192944 RepID=UPI001C9B7B56|nr:MULTISPECIES: alkane 1-monooxygenase [unclassified Rhodococcus (in: high G+C Gram-positive bacteria)]MBY6538922.1 alkane 1-monooxygenase [Rhodococcus sp. BP-363]MBY6543259.1 alkane 1-monooxygenase [Rhodococcus sp. BP-369]MBY6562489.1 alkane 1-monooxygenase [Rhodococcus sp. BP-370]MBY6576781.1 alkane 1-monooxygenase [Rhodococcus sp. BP-364]MBY6586082.1 alkane 1-monooxygenase [Rhodococcus sp. BP-358]